MKTTATLLLISALVVAPFVAQAQTVDEILAETADLSGDAPAPEPEPVDPAVAPALAPEQNVSSARYEVAEDESIYVVQRRAYSKSGHIEVTPFFFTALNPKFVGYAGFGASAAYHLRENLAVEVMSSIYNYRYYSDLVYEVYEYESLTPEEVDLKQLRYYNALSLQYSALYGKLELYGLLLDYDFYVTAGMGLAMTLEPCIPNKDGCSDEVDVGRGLRTPEESGDANKIAANLGGGMRLFFSDYLGLRVEVRDIAYSDRKVEPGQATTDIRNNIMLFLGASILL